MSPEFEPVLIVDEYYDGPRSGIAIFRGQSYRFRSRFSDVYGAEDAVDVFDLIPEGDPSGVAIAAHAIFEVAPDAPSTQPRELRKLVVRWTPIDRPRI